MFVIAISTYLLIIVLNTHGLEPDAKLWPGTSSHRGHSTYHKDDTNQIAETSSHLHQNIDSYGNPIASFSKDVFHALPTHEHDWEQYNNHLEISPGMQNFEVTKSVPFTSNTGFGNAAYEQTINIPKQEVMRIPQPYPVHMPVLQPIGVPVIRTIFVPTEKKVPYAIEKIVPVPVEKPVPITVEKHIPVPVEKPYPIHIPVYKHVFHRISKGRDQGYGRRRRYQRP